MNQTFIPEMSLSKKMCLRSVSQNSDSFDDRFCDDLCEDILQYLPLKEKLRLECVSNRFGGRILLQKQNEIILEEDFNQYLFPRSKGKNLLKLK